MQKIKSLVEARKQFSTQESCEVYVAAKRWPNGVACPRCNSHKVAYMESRRKWQCTCRYQFSVTAGTIFHRTHVDLPRWLMAVWLVCHSPKGVSSKQVQRELGVTYKTAWYITRRIRGAIQNSFLGIVVDGAVELDEAIVKADGSKATGNVSFNTKDVLGMISRDSGVLRFVTLEHLNSENIQRVCNTTLGTVRTIYSDAASRLKFLKAYGPHKSVQHYLGYADGDTHVNNVESAWSLFKRGLIGVYHHVSAKHLQEYLDEFAFRWSHLGDKNSMMDALLASC